MYGPILIRSYELNRCTHQENSQIKNYTNQKENRKKWFLICSIEQAAIQVTERQFTTRHVHATLES